MTTTGTIDITNLVEKLKASFIDWAVAYVTGLEIAQPGLTWVALPVISTINHEVLRAVFTALVSSAEMEAFFLNTSIRKASQAKDYIDAIAFKEALPPTATQEEVAHAEAAQMLAFRNFVVLTN